MNLCFDTYALMDIHNGKASVIELLNENAFITELTLTEFFGVLYRKHGEKTALYWYKRLSHLTVCVDVQILFNAMKFKIDNHQKEFSFFDCVGYIYARENGLKFVTGDEEFKGVEGVF